MNNYEEFLANLDRKAYHEGEFSWEEDGYTCYRAHPWTPPGCHDSCGCIFYMKDGKLQRVEGDPLSPYSNGKLCMRCLDMEEATNHESRIKYPMRLVGERGSNQWERISWDEAVDEIIEKANYYSSTYGPQSIIVVRGTGRDVSFGGGILAHMGFETPNFNMLFNIAWSCYTPRSLSSQSIFGDYWVADAAVGREQRFADPDWQPPGVVIIWACEPLKSNADGYLGHWLVECVQLGTKIICVDPRLTWWGARAEYWLQLRPGTDATIGMAMVNVIVEEDLYDKEFVSNWCYGFDEMMAAIQEWTPEKAAEVAGVKADDIRGAARLFATEGPGTVQWGLPLEQQPNSLAANQIICSLIAICGYVDVPGGALLVRDAFGFPHHFSEAYCPAENMALRPEKVAPDAIWGETRQPIFDWESHNPTRMRMAIFESCNTFGNATGDPGRIYDCFKDSFEYCVGIDYIINPTISALCQLLLPVSMSIESDSFRSWWTPLRCSAKITTYGECLDDVEIAFKIANKMHPEKFKNMHTGEDLQNWRLLGGDGMKKPENDTSQVGEGITEENAKDGGEKKAKIFERAKSMDKANEEKWDSSIDFNKLKTEVFYKYGNFEQTYKKYEVGLLRAGGRQGFSTPTGRIELYSLTYQGWGANPLPYHLEPNFSPISTPELFEEYPLILMSGVRSYEFFHGEHRQLKTMREFHPWPLVCMSPNVAEKYGITEGEWTWVENWMGRFRQKAHIVEGIRDDCITAESGWWYPEEDGAYPNLFRAFDSNPNNCVSIEDVGPYGIGNLAKCMLCRIYPYKEGDVLPTEQIVQLGGFEEQRKRREAYQADWKARGVENN